MSFSEYLAAYKENNWVPGSCSIKFVLQYQFAVTQPSSID